MAVSEIPSDQHILPRKGVGSPRPVSAAVGNASITAIAPRRRAVALLGRSKRGSVHLSRYPGSEIADLRKMSLTLRSLFIG